MKPIIFIPGIEATNLVNANTFGFDIVWNAFDTLGTAVKTKLMGPYLEERLQINPLYDLKTESIIERESIARLPYERAIINLRNRINEKKQFAAPVYLFGYDWRLSNVENGRRLKVFVEYLKEKLKDQNIEGFRFLTHSMGALVFGCYLQQLKVYDEIDKVILCAPPFLGSPYALIHMVKGDGGFKSFLNKIFGRNDDIRKVVRTYPSIYELLPAYPNALTYFDTKAALDLFKKQDWQSNIYDDIEPLFDFRLDELSRFRTKNLADFSKLPPELRKRMVIVVGQEDETLTRVFVSQKDRKIKNLLLLDQIKNGLESGDGTVPEISSTIYKDSIRTIGIKKENIFKELSTGIDFHGLFLQDSRVQNIVMRYFTSPAEATNISNENLTSLKGKAANLWFSVGDSVVNLSPF